MGDIVRGSIEEPETVVDYLKNIIEKYKESDIAEGARLSKMFNELKFYGEGNVRDHLQSMILESLSKVLHQFFNFKICKFLGFNMIS